MKGSSSRLGWKHVSSASQGLDKGSSATEKGGWRRFFQRLGGWISCARQQGPPSSAWKVLRCRVLKLMLLCFLVTLCQVMYVRFFPPLITLTMLERQVEALRSGRPAGLHRSWVDRDALEPAVIQAVLAGEDARFFQHHGFDLEAIGKAWEHNQKGRRIRGASTLSQQTARNLFLWQKRSWVRKGLEAYYTLLLELLVPKERILELYLNVAEWGDMTFGVEAGAQRAFKRSVVKGPRQVSREQAAALSACLPNPRKYPPGGDSSFLRRRKALILKRMNAVSPTDPARADDDE